MHRRTVVDICETEFNANRRYSMAAMEERSSQLSGSSVDGLSLVLLEINGL